MQRFVFALHSVVTGRYFRGQNNTVEGKVVVAGNAGDRQ